MVLQNQFMVLAEPLKLSNVIISFYINFTMHNKKF